MRYITAAMIILTSQAILAAGDKSDSSQNCAESIGKLGMSIAGMVHNFGEILDDSGFDIDPSGKFKKQYLSSLCKEGCTGFCEVASRPTPKANTLSSPGESFSKLLAWCGTYGGDHCISSISKLPRFPKDYGINSQQAFYAFGCMSGGAKSCKELDVMKREMRELHRKECVVKKSTYFCPRYAALLVLNGETKKAHDVLEKSCKTTKDDRTCIALELHKQGGAK